MYQIKETILNTEFNGLTPVKLASKDACETILISLEKGHDFPEHTSPRDATLVVLEGDIKFMINEKTYLLLKHQVFNFPANIKHWVHANENSKFLIIR